MNTAAPARGWFIAPATSMKFDSRTGRLTCLARGGWQHRGASGQIS